MVEATNVVVESNTTTPSEKTSNNRITKKKSSYSDNIPEQKEYYKRISDERKVSSELSMKLAGLSVKLNELRAKQPDYTEKRDSLRKEIDEITEHINKLEAEKTKYVTDINDLNKIPHNKKNEIQSLKHRLQFKDEKDVDEKIKALERAIIYQQLTVNEENKLIAKVRELKNTKALFEKASGSDVDKTSENASKSIKEKLEDVKENLREAYSKRKKLRDTLRHIIEQRQKNLAPIREVSDERDKIRQELAVHQHEESKLMNEMSKKFQEYQANLAAEQKNNLEKWRESHRKKETNIRIENLRRELEQLDEEMRPPEYYLVHQTISYMKKLVETIPKEGTSSVDESNIISELNNKKDIDAEKRQSTDTSLDYLKPKEEREEDYFYAPKSKKKTDKRKKQHTTSLNESLHLSISVLADLHRLSIDPPFTLKDCVECLKQLEDKFQLLEGESLLMSETVQDRRKSILDELTELEENESP